MKNAKPIVLIVLILSVAAGCGPRRNQLRQEQAGYCFQAEGLTAPRCYLSYDDCLEREAVISERHPFAEILTGCKYNGMLRLDNTSVVADSSDGDAEPSERSTAD